MISHFSTPASSSSTKTRPRSSTPRSSASRVRADITMGEEFEGAGGGFRWLTVGRQRRRCKLIFDLQLILSCDMDALAAGRRAPARPRGERRHGRWRHGDRRLPADLQGPLAKGRLTFLAEPTERPYWIEATLCDDPGNLISLDPALRISTARPSEPLTGGGAPAGAVERRDLTPRRFNITIWLCQGDPRRDRPRAKLDRAFGASWTPRRAILARLAEGDAGVLDVAEPFPMSQPAVTKHLRVLEEAGLHLPAPPLPPPHVPPRAPAAQAALGLGRLIPRVREESFERLDELLEELQGPGTSPIDGQEPGRQRRRRKVTMTNSPTEITTPPGEPFIEVRRLLKGAARVGLPALP